MQIYDFFLTWKSIYPILFVRCGKVYPQNNVYALYFKILPQANAVLKNKKGSNCFEPFNCI